MNIDLEKLKYDKNGHEYPLGYRIVYFYDDSYKIGEYCKTIEGFMTGFCDSYPINDESEIPNFVSIDDLLNRYLESMDKVIKVGLYKIDGTLIKIKEKAI